MRHGEEVEAICPSEIVLCRGVAMAAVTLVEQRRNRYLFQWESGSCAWAELWLSLGKEKMKWVLMVEELV